MTKFAFYKSEYGVLKIGYECNFVVLIKVVTECDCENEPNCLTEKVFTQLQEYFNKERITFDLPLKLKGTPFQVKVWNELMKIPCGETRTYKEIAENIGNPNAARAVGSASHSNPLWIVVPCHRVVGKDGRLTGYAGGLTMKELLLKNEKKIKNNTIVSA